MSAIATGLVDRVVVSTDSPAIADVARSFGAEVPWLRPPELARADSPELLAWRHAISSFERGDGTFPFEVFVSVPPTAPLRSPQDVVRSIDLYRTGAFDLVLTVVRSDKHPAYNLLRRNDDGSAELLEAPEQQIYRRQDLPPTFEIRPVAYVSNARHILSSAGIMTGRIGVVEVEPETAIDIDGELDFRMAELLLAREEQS